MTPKWSRIPPPNQNRSANPLGASIRITACSLLLAIPVAIVEPLKMAGFVVVGTGHWIDGAAILALFAYILSLSLCDAPLQDCPATAVGTTLV